ncbi:ABC transporter ATP-binding protein [Helicobacter jaachi]|uniref:ABC transporter ATP-binding protein n=1 Tax=Helicobacter jaachi TaxID=1677920 RepID=A0A4U8TCG2_9HELI|nr:ABC transporter ATP-binding protein [Helicobacter jaachi]TLD96337.1 ABC transporter ATP-binding protein [Helicobacter jaachi]
MLRIVNLVKNYGSKQILKNINLDIKQGEFLTLVGESGSGKSTLLRIIAGLEEKSSGQILKNDKDISHTAPKDRDFAMVFQSYALYPHFNVAQNLAAPLNARAKFSYKLPFARFYNAGARAYQKQIQDKVLQVAKQLKIEHLLESKPKQLSGGQCQRVALGRAMTRNPNAFLMDEPLSNLDAKLRAHMRSELVNLHRELNKTFIYVTHDQTEAMTMSTRIAFLVDGQLLQVDTPDNMYNNPNHLKVAQFIGTPTINTTLVSVQGDEVIFGADIAHLSEDSKIKNYRATHTFAIRPEDVSINPNSAFKAKVQTIENMGNEYLIHIVPLFANAEFIISVNAHTGKQIHFDEIIGIELNLSKAMYFNLQGQRDSAISPQKASITESSKTNVPLSSAGSATHTPKGSAAKSSDNNALASANLYSNELDSIVQKNFAKA